MNRIEGRTALVTGASSGIGEACARAFAASGAHLVLVARRRSRLVELAAELRSSHGTTARVEALDVRHRAELFRLAGRLESEGRVPEVLINNAGLSRGLERLHEGDPEGWDEMIDTNVKGLLNVSRAVIPLMVKRNRGHIVNLGSIAGHQVYPGGNVYNATKFAVRALNEAMSVDLVGTKIRVSNIEPGMVRTEFSTVRFHGDRARAGRVYEGLTPLRPEDVADAVRYVVNAPDHVNVLSMLILPTDQRSGYVVHREGD